MFLTLGSWLRGDEVCYKACCTLINVWGYELWVNSSMWQLTTSEAPLLVPACASVELCASDCPAVQAACHSTALLESQTETCAIQHPEVWEWGKACAQGGIPDSWLPGSQGEPAQADAESLLNMTSVAPQCGQAVRDRNGVTENLCWDISQASSATPGALATAGSSGPLSIQWGKKTQNTKM